MSGADIYWLNERAVERHRDELDRLIEQRKLRPEDLERAKGTALVVHGQTVVTVHRASRPKRYWKPSDR